MYKNVCEDTPGFLAKYLSQQEQKYTYWIKLKSYCIRKIDFRDFTTIKL